MSEKVAKKAPQKTIINYVALVETDMTGKQQLLRFKADSIVVKDGTEKDYYVATLRGKVVLTMETNSVYYILDSSNGEFEPVVKVSNKPAKPAQVLKLLKDGEHL